MLIIEVSFFKKSYSQKSVDKNVDSVDKFSDKEDKYILMWISV